MIKNHLPPGVFQFSLVYLANLSCRVHISYVSLSLHNFRRSQSLTNDSATYKQTSTFRAVLPLPSDIACNFIIPVTSKTFGWIGASSGQEERNRNLNSPRPELPVRKPNDVAGQPEQTVSKQEFVSTGQTV